MSTYNKDTSASAIQKCTSCNSKMIIETRTHIVLTRIKLDIQTTKLDNIPWDNLKLIKSKTKKQVWIETNLKEHFMQHGYAVCDYFPCIPKKHSFNYNLN